MNFKRLIIRSIPDILWDYYGMYRYKKRSQAALKNGDLSNTFDTIYKSNFWNSHDSFSGTGSDLKQTEVVRSALTELIEKYKVTKMLDIPCGDFNWMKHVDLQGVHYLGGDIVKDLIAANRAKFSNLNIEFQTLNLLEDSLPKVDLIFCRDCLVHFSYDHIAAALKNIKKSGSNYLLTTSFIKRRLNYDIHTGDWRPINLQRTPFNLWSPLEIILEKCTEGNGKSYDKSLLLYKISDL
jgi:SAM-dependent methyltransferase